MGTLVTSPIMGFFFLFEVNLQHFGKARCIKHIAIQRIVVVLKILGKWASNVFTGFILEKYT